MKALLKHTRVSKKETFIKVTGSKSESNRLLLLQALYPSIAIKNLSESDDTRVLQKALQVESGLVDVHHAGTAMRFLTAYFATKEGAEITLSGSKRMHERPIKILVDALCSLGASITYLKEEGYPPLQISGKKIIHNQVTLKANVSSQYISALLLIAPSLPHGLTISLEGKITSVPYIKMTLALLDALSIENTFKGNTLTVHPKSNVSQTECVVESDWSSASYFYSFVALGAIPSVTISSYSEKSLQGDAALASIYKELGVKTVFNASETSVTLSASEEKHVTNLIVDLANTPDIAQTIVVTCFGLGIGCTLTGLHTLKIKETDRLSALKNELEKFGAQVSITNDSLQLESCNIKALSEKTKETIVVDTYSDHRMAMAFAPLALQFLVCMNDPMVVTKSFPSFWEDIQKMGVLADFQ
ncbi:3-phosphoshikimate 1-carboxyvinyltransferase [Ulvibacter litoralis]|uniref:3-phosphoshikimate 1-carboxyvinyltransferase n=1 Tax=Ulvibacter litoralis TaxID=227084 RepID=A0A1G7C7C9_9FLAO|nr:3-phosphoshikimate 1-carboxyvinyltransferase [Ulvibacter litoralis]GHC48651.1 3-phosphoshikimate 1-carboxyvinyltransferase [Ulvibacter litoralis]SDE34345.1 3-phosphoshikimate 1-carboxyvinyltransferase [Ulvibacter litoralis]